MIGKPKVGQVWTAHSIPDSDFVWRYQILAVINHGGKRFYVGGKDNGEQPWVLLFGDDGVETVHGDYRLVERSRAKPFLTVEAEIAA